MVSLSPAIDFGGKETEYSFPSWLLSELQLSGSAAVAQSPSSSKTSIGSLFEVDPNYLVQTEPHSAFVTRLLGFTVCGEAGTRVNFLP